MSFRAIPSPKAEYAALLHDSPACDQQALEEIDWCIVISKAYLLAHLTDAPRVSDILTLAGMMLTRSDRIELETKQAMERE